MVQPGNLLVGSGGMLKIADYGVLVGLKVRPSLGIDERRKAAEGNQVEHGEGLAVERGPYNLG